MLGMWRADSLLVGGMDVFLSFSLAFLMSLLCLWGEGIMGESVYVPCSPLHAVTSVFALFRTLPSPPPLSLSSKCSPSVPCASFVHFFSGLGTA